MKWNYGRKHHERQQKLALEFQPEPLHIPRERWRKPYGFTGSELSQDEIRATEKNNPSAGSCAGSNEPAGAAKATVPGADDKSPSGNPDAQGRRPDGKKDSQSR
jgi:hypothetical protein